MSITHLAKLLPIAVASLTVRAEEHSCPENADNCVCENDDDHCPEDWLDDGYCDDGGPGSSWDYCRLGTDCDDCGTRCPYGYERVDGECLECSHPDVVTWKEVKTETCKPETCVEGKMLNGARTECVENWVDTPGCNNDCQYNAENGRCQDHGDGSVWWSSCTFGSDCADCGERVMPDCENATEPKYDGTECIECSRPNASTFANAPGCIIASCNPDYEHLLHIRTGGVACDPVREGPGCNHSCDNADNGYCEDGGPGQSPWRSKTCELGTDCADCGERVILDCTNKTEQTHTDELAHCIPCERDYATDFDAEAIGCVITNCTTDRYVRPGGQFCDDAPIGIGCQHTCQTIDNSWCEDGSPDSNSWWSNCELGTDCGDCGLQCMHGWERDLDTGNCKMCERSHAMEFDLTKANQCVITRCAVGYELMEHRWGKACQATVASCLNASRPGYHIDEEKNCRKCEVEGAATYVPENGDCQVVTCEADYRLDSQKNQCISTVVPPKPTEAKEKGDIGKANDAGDSGFNPLWLLLLLIPVLLLVGVAAFFMTKKKGSGSASDMSEKEQELVAVEDREEVVEANASEQVADL